MCGAEWGGVAWCGAVLVPYCGHTGTTSVPYGAMLVPCGAIAVAHSAVVVPHGAIRCFLSPRFTEKGHLEVLLFTIQSRMRSNNQKVFVPRDGALLADINRVRLPHKDPQRLRGTCRDLRRFIGIYRDP